MTRKEAIRQTQQADTLRSLGFTYEEAEALRRISMTLHRWSEHECNGDIERDGDDGDGAPYRSYAAMGGKHHAYRIPDRERGALKRLAMIVDNCNKARRTHLNASGQLDPWEPLTYYHQSDPRGCALYIIRPGDVPEGEDVGSYYNRGIAVY